jgi:hypothetical protein
LPVKKKKSPPILKQIENFMDTAPIIKKGMESMTQGDNFRKITAQWNQKKHKEGEVSL